MSDIEGFLYYLLPPEDLEEICAECGDKDWDCDACFQAKVEY